MTVNKFNLPDVGEGLTEAEIVSWKVKAGDTVLFAKYSGSDIKIDSIRPPVFRPKMVPRS